MHLRCCQVWSKPCAAILHASKTVFACLNWARYSIRQPRRVQHRLKRAILRVLSAVCDAEQWAIKNSEADFYDPEGRCRKFAETIEFIGRIRRFNEAFPHPGRSANIMLHGNKIGWLGDLHRALLKFVIWRRGFGFRAGFIGRDRTRNSVGQRAVQVSVCPPGYRAGRAGKHPLGCIGSQFEGCFGPFVAGRSIVRPLCRNRPRTGIKEPRYGLDFAGRFAHPNRLGASQGGRRSAVRHWTGDCGAKRMSRFVRRATGHRG